MESLGIYHIDCFTHFNRNDLLFIPKLKPSDRVSVTQTKCRVELWSISKQVGSNLWFLLLFLVLISRLAAINVFA